MELLHNVVQHYAWGSRRAIPELCQIAPDGRPQAEMWMGAHPVAPSAIRRDGRRLRLDDLISSAPAETVGPHVCEQFGDRLPFLLKVLAAAEPLSLQAHPSLAQAREGFAREEQAGIPRDAPNRSFRDEQHKPELICALTPFEALSGFRPVSETLTLLRSLDTPALAGAVDALAQKGEAALRDLLREWLAHPDPAQVAAVVAACSAAAEGPYQASRLWAVRLAEMYGDDPGVLISLLLNHVELAPGQAMFLDAGNLHAYLDGVGVEIMASSDNVLRGGLTEKHVDVDALADIVDPSPIAPAVQIPDEPLHRYHSPVAEFTLYRVVFDPSFSVQVVSDGPAIVLAVDGTIEGEGSSHSGPLRIESGHAAFIPAGEQGVTLTGAGLGFVAAVGDPVTSSLLPRSV